MSIELSFQWFADLFTPDNLLLGVVALGILILIVVVDRIVRRAITRYSRTVLLDKNLENGFKLISRIIVFAIGAIALLQVFGVKADWLISVSALGGAAIGFASTQTVGNLLAGVYLMLSRPFLVNDYVRIGEIEGAITEITVNYTKLYTPTYNVVAIPNRRILDSTIVNYSKGDIIDWTFTIGFPHDVPHNDLVERCITPALNDFYTKYGQLLPSKPQYGLCTIDRLGRAFSIRIFFPERKMDTFYNIQPEILGAIINRWDTVRKKP